MCIKLKTCIISYDLNNISGKRSESPNYEEKYKSSPGLFRALLMNRRCNFEERLRGGTKTPPELLSSSPTRQTNTQPPIISHTDPQTSNWEVLSKHTFILRRPKETVSNPGTGRRSRNEARKSVPDVFISHAGHLVIDSTYIKEDDSSQDVVEDKEDSPQDPYRKNTLSSGEVTVIINHDAESDTLGRKRLKHKTVTNIFSSHTSSDCQDKQKHQKNDSQVQFNIEALRIAKRAHDLQELNRVKYKNNKKVKHKQFFNQLRKFKSLPNLSALRSITMKRSRTKNEVTEISEPNIRLNIKGNFGVWDNVNKDTQKNLDVVLIENKVRQINQESSLTISYLLINYIFIKN